MVELHKRARSNIKTWRKLRRQGIDCRTKLCEIAAVDKIVFAVESSLRQRHKPQTVSKWLNRRRLRLDIDRAIQGYGTFQALGKPQPWTARLKRGNEIVAAIHTVSALFGRDGESGEVLSNRDDPSIWYDKQVSRALVANFRSALLKVERIKETISPELEVGIGRQSASAFLGPENPIQWLVGERLAYIYERWFGRKTTNQPNSAYGAFVQAVLGDAKIMNRDGTPLSAETIFIYRKQGIRRGKK